MPPRLQFLVTAPVDDLTEADITRRLNLFRRVTAVVFNDRATVDLLNPATNGHTT